MHRAQRSQLVTKGPDGPSENSTTLGIRQVGHSEVMMARLALPRAHAKRPYIVSISATMVTPLIMFLLLLPIVYSRYNSHILLKHVSVHSCLPVHLGRVALPWLPTSISKIPNLHIAPSPILFFTFLMSSATQVQSAPAALASLLSLELNRSTPTRSFVLSS